MDRSVIFRDRQELQSDDNNNVQLFMQRAVANALLDAVGAGQFFTGFDCSATGTWEITAQPGRFYANGTMYSKPGHSVIDLFNLRPLSQRKIVAITTWGQVVETDIQPRDYLIDAETGATEPRSVAMEALNSAEISQIPGSEDASPVEPSVPNNNVLLALVTLSTSGIDTIEMQYDNLLPQTLRNQAQLQAMVAWQSQVASSFDSLRSDLANMGQDLATKASSSAVEHLIDRTLLLEAGFSRNWEAHKRLEEEVGASSVLLLANTEHFINDTKSDTDHADYAARVGGGLSFPLSASSTPVGGIELQDPADPKVTVQNGMMTPVSSSKNRTLENGSVNGAVQIQSYTNVEHTSRAMTGYSDASHYGPGNYHYENFVGVPGVAWNAQSARPSGKKMIGGVKYSLARYDETSPGSGTFKLTYITIVEAQREYTYYVQEEVETTITAQGRGQTVYAANGGWLDQIGFHVTGNGPGNIEVLVCECDGSGTPDLNKALARTTLAAGDIVQGINQVPIEPVYIAPGTRYAPVFLSTGAYNLGTTSTGRAVTNGQHFALVGSNRFEVPGTEGEKDLFLQLRYKTHEATTVAVTLQPLQLADGIDSLKIAFKRVIPQGTNVYFEVMVGSTWYRCGPGQSIPEVDWSLQPNLMPFRVVFVGTKDGMPSIGIGANSEITVGRVATSLTHIAEPIDAGAVASEVRVRVRMDGFDEAKHDCVVSLIVASVEKTATAVEDATIDGNSIYRTATFSLAEDANQQFAPKIVASMSNVAEPFSITERFDYAAV